MNAKSLRGLRATCILFGLAAAGMLSLPAQATMPVVKTVPWVASNPLIPHTTFPTKEIRLKGAADLQGASVSNFAYTWDFGDLSAPLTGTVTDQRIIEASHTYAGTLGQIFTATLTVRDKTTNETASRNYYVEMKAKTQETEVNVAIDEGLWYLHKTMVPYLTDQGYWIVSYNTETPASLNAFFVNGHLETGAASNPYTDTVQRGMRRLFTLLAPYGITNQTYPAPIGTVNPDSNGNGIGIFGYDTQNYSSGIFMDAIVASGTPDAMTTTGTSPWVIGRKYKDIVQDMVDFYAGGQTDAGTWMGGWGYDYNNQASDNSVNQWAAIGMMGAQGWGGTVVVPQFVKDANKNSLNTTQASTANCGASYDGAFAYTNSYCYFPWGPYGTTPAGMVQMVFDGIGRGDAQWNRTENFIRNNFCSSSTSSQANIRKYYYGLFSFTKSMLLMPASKGGPIQFLANQPGNTNPIDWYAAEASAGAQCDGVARTLLNDQQADGHWLLHNDFGYHTGFSTAWAIMMLNRTVFESGVPVAVAKAIPSYAVAGQTITLDGSASFQQDSGKAIVKWEWDVNNNGVFTDPTDKVGPVVTTSFAAMGNYPVTLRVTDNSVPPKTATSSVTVQVALPPLPPTANAGGPYNFCPGPKWYLNGTGSVNPDEGLSEAGKPGDTMSYAWDLGGGYGSGYAPVNSAQPEVTTYFAGKGTGSYIVQLMVTDTTAASFPSSGYPNQSSTAGTAVHVLAASDPSCSCIGNLAARAKSGKISLTWTPQTSPSVASYNVYRGTVSGGPYAKIGSTVSTYATFLDSPAVNGTAYYYVVRPAAANSNELCQSNQAAATATAR